jgi:hypothetical protein
MPTGRRYRRKFIGDDRKVEFQAIGRGRRPCPEGGRGLWQDGKVRLVETA